MVLWYYYCLLFLQLSLLGTSLAFIAPSSSSGIRSASRSSHQQLHLTEDMIPDENMFARGYAVFWFFGASGAAGIGRSAFPQQYKRYKQAQELKGMGPTQGGPTLGLPAALCGYPQDICKADIEQVLNNPLSVKEMIRKYPIENPDFLASIGFLNIESFEKANSKANPLAVRAIFDSFTMNNDNIEPRVAQEQLDKYKQGEKGLNDLKVRILTSKLLVWMGVLCLLFLLGIADIFAFSDLYRGWFPDWPGGSNFPFSLFTEPEGSLFKIPDYWI